MTAIVTCFSKKQAGLYNIIAAAFGYFGHYIIRLFAQQICNSGKPVSFGPEVTDNHTHCFYGLRPVATGIMQ